MLTASITTIKEIDLLIEDKIQESLHLDYKSSGALVKSKRDEIAKDVSALANSDGGALVYGVQEKGHIPESRDNGTSNSDMTKEWLENILSSTISPKIPDLLITQIEASDTSSYYIIDVPKSYSGPHQSPDKKYYKRYNFKSSPMDDYEVRDIRVRQLTVSRLVAVDLEVLHGTYFAIVVHNPGIHPAEDVTFEFSPELFWGKKEVPRLLENGTKYLPPGRRFRFWYLSATEVLGEKPKGPVEFTVTANYFHPELNHKHSESFRFDFRDFLGSEADKDPIGSISDEIKKGFREVSNTIRSIRSR